jgi:hypothetical protein
MRAVLTSISGSVAVLATTCSVAFGQTSGLEPGVHADPGSPAGKEYVLPLNNARQTGSESRRSSPTLFGAGITPPSSGGSASSKGGHGARGASIKGTASAGSARAPATLPAAVLRAARSSTGAGGGSTLALIGGGVAILVLGGLGGVVLRHSRRPPSHA